jgi:hypothetical protein
LKLIAFRFILDDWRMLADDRRLSDEMGDPLRVMMGI